MYAVAAFYKEGIHKRLYHIWYYKELEDAKKALLEKKENAVGLYFMHLLMEVPHELR